MSPKMYYTRPTTSRMESMKQSSLVCLVKMKAATLYVRRQCSIIMTPNGIVFDSWPGISSNGYSLYKNR